MAMAMAKRKRHKRFVAYGDFRILYANLTDGNSLYTKKTILRDDMNFDRPQHLDKSVSIEATNRPIKIAYLIPYEETSDNHLIIDAVFYESYTRWSGARTLIIPTQTKDFLYKAHENWLEFYDPDFVYSFVDIDQQLIEKIDTLCSPIAFIRHKNRGDSTVTGWRDYIPDLRIYCNPISSVSTIHSPYAGFRRAFGVKQNSNITVVTQYGDAGDSFLQDNFGTAFDLDSTTYPVPSLYDTLCLAPTGLDERMIVGTKKVHTITEILSHIAAKKALPISKFAMAHSKSIPSVEHSSWSRSFNLFIGETCNDRIHFWNARHFSPDYIDTQGALIVGKSHFDDLEFIKQLGQYLNKLNFLGQQYGSPRVEIRSFSHSYEELSPIREKLAKQTFNTIFLEKKIFNKPVTPDTDDFKNFHVRQPDLKIHKVHENINKIQATEPEHLLYTPPRFRGLNKGQWIVELEIERHNNLSRFSNVIDTWLLPRRKSVVEAFSSNLGKITNTHYLALIPSTEGFPFSSDKIKNDYMYDLRLPGDEAVFRYLTLPARPYPDDDLRSKLSQQTYEDIAVSDKGKICVV